MTYEVFETEEEAAIAAAETASAVVKRAIESKNRATFVAATGKSQLVFIEKLVNDASIEWSKTKMFHLDEYVGLPATHPASFRHYLRERLVDKVHPGTVHLIEGDSGDLEQECERLNKLITGEEIDVAFVGIGENGHLAFNDPPADFENEKPFIVVELDEACRRQQLGEGWFSRLSDVPERAITMSVKQIMRSKQVICVVPGMRKARAIKACFEEEISPLYPASILREHPAAFVYLDKSSASELAEYRMED